MTKKTTKKNEMVVEASYEKDTKRKTRYKVGDYGEAISGTLYFDKETVKTMPKRIVIDIIEEED